MTNERNVLTFRCGGPLDVTSDAPVFNDLADTRNWRLDKRVGLLRAVELVRAIGGSDHCGSVPDLVIEDPADLADEKDRWIVAMLVEAAGSRLLVGGWPIATDYLDRHENLGYVLRWFAEVGKPALLKSPVIPHNWKQAAAHYLCSDLGLTGKQAAWALNLVTNPGTFNDKSVRYYATKTDQIKGFIDTVHEMPDLNPMTVSVSDEHMFQVFLGSRITLRLQEELPPEMDQDVFRYAALAYNKYQPQSLDIPAGWPTPSLRPSWERDIDAAMRIIVPVRRRAYAKRPWPPADHRRARTFATKLAKQGSPIRDIAAALDEEGYRVSRKGGWHYRSVTELLQSAEAEKSQGDSR